jgi:2-oxoglutarate dehydrogenase E2 component (dihydrolipoamide succinyltransferase)
VIVLIETADSGIETQETAGSRVSSGIAETTVPTAVPVRQYKQEEDAQITPLIRMLAKQRGITSSEISKIPGTGEGNTITKDDLNQFLINRPPVNGESGKLIIPVKAAETQVKPEIINAGADDEVFEMDRMRKIIASHMTASKQIAAHVTSFLEADVTALVKWREAHKEEFYKNEGAKFTYTPVFIESVVRALKLFPRINVTVAGESIILHRGIHIGVATALSDGNLIVPVIRNADLENIGGLARRLNDLAARARTGNLLPEEVRGGTFTITNIGQYNNLTGTSIINQPESAILAFGTILKKPWAVKTPEGYGVAVRDIMMLALSYDHRVIDGALGGSFLSSVAKHLEGFEMV